MGALIQKSTKEMEGGLKETRLLILGLDAAGKTTVTNKLKLMENVQSVATVGFNQENLQYKNLTMTMWNFGDLTKMRAMYHHYFNGTNALMFVLDSSDLERFDKVQDSIHYYCSQESLKDVPLLVFANKSDIATITSNEIMEKLKLNTLHQDWYVKQCCAFTGDGLQDGLDWLNNVLTTKK